MERSSVTRLARKDSWFGVLGLFAFQGVYCVRHVGSFWSLGFEAKASVARVALFYAYSHNLEVFGVAGL